MTNEEEREKMVTMEKGRNFETSLEVGNEI
jgi:hypothetical protein